MKLLIPVFIFLAILGIANASTGGNICGSSSFSYDGWREPSTSPMNWPNLCHFGFAQSPIDLKTRGSGVQLCDAEGDEGVKLLGYETASLRDYTLTNNGHSVQITLSDAESQSVGLLLGGWRYSLKQFHFHWPSEHKINGRRHVLEMHLVHERNGKYVVAALLYNIGSSTNAGLQQIIPLLNRVVKPSALTQFSGKPVIKLNNFIDLQCDSPAYFSYVGSLTTPPCTQGVQWIVLAKALKISSNDYRSFNSVERCDTTSGHVIYSDSLPHLLERGNYRPTQHLNGRTVKLCI